MAWDTSVLLSRIRRRLRIPDGSSAMSNVELLQIADEVTRIDLMGLLRLSNGEWYVTKYTTPIVADQSDYRLPSRIQAGSVRDVTLVDSNGAEYDLPELLLEQARTLGSVSGDQVRGHFIEGDRVVLRPTPTTADLTLCIRYRRQPSVLIETSSVNAVEIISGTSTGIIAEQPLVSPFNATIEVDVVQANPPFDVLVTGSGSPSGSVMTISGTPDLTNEVTRGDWLCVAGETPVPQMPPVLQDLLAWGVAKEAAVELGLTQMANDYERKYRMATERVFDQINDRNEGADQKIVSPYSPLRQRSGWGWRAG